MQGTVSSVCKLVIIIKAGRSQGLPEKTDLHRVKLLMPRNTDSGLLELCFFFFFEEGIPFSKMYLFLIEG